MAVYQIGSVTTIAMTSIIMKLARTMEETAVWKR